MSFSPDIRSSTNFQRQFSNDRRRLQLSEIPKADLDTLQESVVEMRTYTHFVDVVNNVDNINDIPIGPHDYILEPDYDTVKIRNLFLDPYGVNQEYSFQTVNGLSYYTLKMFDQAGMGQIRSAVKHSVVGNLDDIFNTDKLWKWKVGFHPPQLKRGNSVSLNVGTNTQQMIYHSNFGTAFDFTNDEFSIGFWIYPESVFSSAAADVVAYRYVDSSNKWSIEIDLDGKLFVIVKDAGVETKRQYDTVLSVNTWYFVCVTWDPDTASLVLKVNDNADTSSTKTTGTTATSNNLFFGSYAGASSDQDYQGYLTGITYYKRDPVLTTTEMTRLYNYNTISDTVKPFTWGFGQYG